MQKQLVATLAKIVDDALQHVSNPADLEVLKRFIQALKDRNRTNLLRESKLVLAMYIDSSGLVSLTRAFWLTLMVVVGFTGDRQLFEAFVAWFVGAGYTRDKIEVGWSQIQLIVMDLADDQAIDPALAAENIEDLTIFAKLIGESIERLGSSSANNDLRYQMANTHASVLRVILMNLQPLLDRGLEELAAAKPPKGLRALAKIISELQKLTSYGDGIGIQATNVDFPRHPDRFIDSFPLYGSRSFEALQYDLYIENALEPRMTRFHLALDRRFDQIRFSLSLYGQNIDPSASLSNEHKLRQKTLRGMSKPSFLDHDDFAHLLCALFMETYEPLKADPAKAIEAGWSLVTDVIESYLDLFTDHSGYDLSDLGPNYLTTAFPRTIAGEMLHDCSVYAVTIVYWLLNLQALLRLNQRIELGLTARFVILPIHLGLLVEINPPAMATNADGLPSGGVFIAHNSHMHRLTVKELVDAKKVWDTGRPAADIDPTGKPELMLKFLEDLTASLYLNGVDMPVSSNPVIGPKDKPTRDTVWQSFFDYANKSKKGKIFAREVGAKSGDTAQFYLKYLAILKARSTFFNEVLVNDFWRKSAPELWVQLFDKPEWWADKTRLFLLDGYVLMINSLIQSYTDKIGKFISDETDARNEITAAIDDKKKKIISKDARRLFSERTRSVKNADLLEPLTTVSEHSQECEKFSQDVKAKKPHPAPSFPPYMIYSMREQIL